MIGQEIKREMAVTHQREDEEPLDLLLDHQIGSIEPELENEN